MNRTAAGHKDPGRWFENGATDSPPLLQVQAIDLDFDGWTDVVGLSERRRPVLLHNDGQRLVHRKDAFGPEDGWPRDLVGTAVGLFSGGKYLDLIVWSEAGGLLLHVNQGNGNHALKLVLSGHRRVESFGPFADLE